jgi:hypothetical protein
MEERAIWQSQAEAQAPAQSVATMVDEFFAREVDVVENGLPLRRIAFEIIYLQLCNKAIAGNTRALNVLKKYADFAASRDPTGGMRLQLIEEHERSKAPGEKNG